MSPASGRPIAGATESGTLQFFARPTAMTALGRHAALVEELPSGVDQLAQITQGLIIYDAVASELLRRATSPRNVSERSTFRPIEQVIMASSPWMTGRCRSPRPPDRRLAGRCHHYARLLVAALREKGIPAARRCGFGAYFNPGYFEDHVVCEALGAEAEQRWVLADPQFDEAFCERLQNRSRPPRRSTRPVHRGR